MQNLLKNKALLILSMFMLCIFVLCTNCFANSDLVFSDNNTYSVPDFSLDEGCNYFITRYLNNGSLCIYMYDKNYNLIKNLQGSSYYFNLYDVDNNIITTNNIHFLEYNSSSFLAEEGYTGGVSFRDDFAYYSNVNIYDTDNNLVFQVAPQEITKVELMKEIQVEEIPQQIAGVVMIVLPIFLLIFGTLLVLYLLKSKNLLNL